MHLLGSMYLDTFSVAETFINQIKDHKSKHWILMAKISSNGKSVFSSLVSFGFSSSSKLFSNMLLLLVSANGISLVLLIPEAISV